MKIILLNKNDAEKIVNLEKDNFADGYNINVLNSSFDSGRFFAFGIEDSGELVSIITLSTSIESVDIDGIFTSVNYRKKGYATILLNKAIEFTKENKINTIFLEVRKSNLTAISLYQKFGFSKISERKKYYSDGENAIIFKKDV